jgi:hypothetical protein
MQEVVMGGNGDDQIESGDEHEQGAPAPVSVPAAWPPVKEEQPEKEPAAPEQPAPPKPPEPQPYIPVH